jgi:hypothetical protein
MNFWFDSGMDVFVEVAPGHTFFYNGHRYKCVHRELNQYDCTLCPFRDMESDVCEVMLCSEKHRRDKKRVIFVEVP